MRLLTTLRAQPVHRYAFTDLTCDRHLYPIVLIQLISSLHRSSRTFERKLTAALQSVPSHLLALPSRSTPLDFPPDIISPIFPILTSAPIPLANFLRSHGYAARPVPYPVVPRGQERIRVVMHARNTEEEFDELIAHLLEWATVMQKEERVGEETTIATAEVATARKLESASKDRFPYTISLPGTAVRINLSVLTFG